MYLESANILIINILLLTAQCTQKLIHTVSVLHTHHPRFGNNGKYFFFNKNDFTTMIGETNWNNKKYEVIQRGSNSWKGRVIVWDGSTGTDKIVAGRRDSGAAAGNWAVGDTIQLEACVAKSM